MSGENGVISAITTAMNSIKTDFMSAFGDILPIALSIMGAMLVVVLAVRAFKRIAK